MTARVSVSVEPRIRYLLALATVLVCAICATNASAQQSKHVSLTLSPNALGRVHQEATRLGLPLLNNSKEVQRDVSLGLLEELEGDNYILRGASFPYATPRTREFVDFVAGGVGLVCGEEKLAVTSATRPGTHRPPNGAIKSLHRTGIAVDFGIPRSRFCKDFTEDLLRLMDNYGVVVATEAPDPPRHYHVVVWPAGRPPPGKMEEVNPPPLLAQVQVIDTTVSTTAISEEPVLGEEEFFAEETVRDEPSITRAGFIPAGTNPDRLRNAMIFISLLLAGAVGLRIAHRL
jgi:hypothetical protein